MIISSNSQPVPPAPDGVDAAAFRTRDLTSTSGAVLPPQSPIGLYVHIPFCVKKCTYCDFATWAGREKEIPRYVDAVIEEIARRGEETGHPKADTIFLGGGTPSLLNEEQITCVLGALHNAFTIEAGAEITCECNPETLTPGFARAARKAGVNRISMGAQSKQPNLLQILGRIHNWERVISAVDILRQAGFDNYNIDLMFGLPTQTVADMRETLEGAIALEPTHLSCYGLIVEERTPICHDVTTGKLTLPDEEVERDMYELVRQKLGEHGYQQYEISNFAREGCACRHNLGCWTRVPYLGFGCAAHSFFDERRTMNPRKIDAYLAGEEPEIEEVTTQEARFESMMLGLRVTRGVKNDDFARMHGIGIREAFGEKLDKPVSAGLVEWHDGALRLTRLGMDLQNSVLVDLM
jgi:oxygen-independent coproporphyrinogen-3 oxidase